MTDDLLSLEADLRDVPATANRNVKKALEITARHVKDDWRQGAEIGQSDPGFAERYASSIFYDIRFPDEGIEAEIGPELGRPGGSAGFLEEAPGGVQSAPQHAGRDALEANEPDFVEGMEIAIFEALAEKVERA